MNQRLVKPYFWPVLIASCVAFSVMLFFLIAGMVRSHTVAFTIGEFNVPGEDYFIAALVGFVLFLAARTVRNNANEVSTAAMALIFGSIVIAGIATWGMNYALTASYRLVEVRGELTRLYHVNFAQFIGHNHALLNHLGYFHPWRGVDQLSTYREWFNVLHIDWEFPLNHTAVQTVQRAIHLSYGIIAGLVFMGLQAVTLFLLFFRTKPAKKEFRH
ncbi:MAG: hypothetical protein FWB91_06225 [Defluviitaleaceae bacterium]|nr:hypothetical protein [Defluviitaleaceae bacterium]